LASGWLNHFTEVSCRRLPIGAPSQNASIPRPKHYLTGAVPTRPRVRHRRQFCHHAGRFGDWFDRYLRLIYHARFQRQNMTPTRAASTATPTRVAAKGGRESPSRRILARTGRRTADRFKSVKFPQSARQRVTAATKVSITASSRCNGKGRCLAKTVISGCWLACT
jgi:hypothetical protein